MTEILEGFIRTSFPLLRLYNLELSSFTCARMDGVQNPQS